jgi:transcriptional regulator with XRE-family HTH domain
MTDKTIKYGVPKSDDAIIKTIGNFVRHHRLEQNITQKDLAEKAGINRTTLSDLELGRRFQLITLIQVLRILDQLHVFGDFEIKQQISPMLLAEIDMNKRLKASGKQEKDNYTSEW